MLTGEQVCMYLLTVNNVLKATLSGINYFTTCNSISRFYLQYVSSLLLHTQTIIYQIMLNILYVHSLPARLQTLIVSQGDYAVNARMDMVLVLT